MSDTPTFDALALETFRAQLDDTERVEALLGVRDE